MRDFIKIVETMTPEKAKAIFAHYGGTDLSPEGLKRTRNALALKNHPDRGGDAEAAKQINAAYDVLSQKASVVPDRRAPKPFDFGTEDNALVASSIALSYGLDHRPSIRIRWENYRTASFGVEASQRILALHDGEEIVLPDEELESDRTIQIRRSGDWFEIKLSHYSMGHDGEKTVTYGGIEYVAPVDQFDAVAHEVIEKHHADEERRLLIKAGKLKRSPHGWVPVDQP